jgi:hypothetical protein
MKIALLHNHYNQKHLDDVKKEMNILGAPTIKVVWMACYDCYAAIEGCHRIRAAKELNLMPVIEEIDYDEKISDLVDDCHRREIINF